MVGRGRTGWMALAGLWATAALAQGTAAPAPQPAPPVERDWPALLRADARAIATTFRDSHPGSVDPLNPGFATQVDKGLQKALTQADVAKTAGHWWWALRENIAAYDDGHVQLYQTEPRTPFPVRWAGVLTGYRDGKPVVLTRDETDAAAPPLGAVLLECDGVDAETLGTERVGRFRGRWTLASQRARHGWSLLADISNPWIPPPQACTFETDRGTTRLAMRWRSLSDDDLETRLEAMQPRPDNSFGIRTLPDGTVWIGLPSFDGTVGGEAHTALTALLADAEARRDAIRAAPRIVLDLRGNGGGSSHWSQRLAEILWGKDWVAANPAKASSAVDWRPSDANLAAIEDYLANWESDPKTDPAVLTWGREVRDGMKAARAAGKPYFRADSRSGGKTPEAAAATPPAIGPVYALTDPACASACLDALDTWKPLGIIQVGSETSADSLYMDVRSETLPSGLAGIAVPMKVYRDRPRGNNEPYRPDHTPPPGTVTTAALAAWIATLPPPKTAPTAPAAR